MTKKIPSHLLSHSEENLTDKEQLERISNYFASIANEFPKLKEEDLSEEVKHKLNNIEHNEINSISSQFVYNVMRQIKKKKSSVPGDIPPCNNDDVRLSLAEPGAMLANSVAKSGQWPRQFKTEWGVVVRKEPNTATEKQVRIISCLNQMAKVLEKVILNCLMKYIKPYFDPEQMGGQKGHSISHYLVEVSNFILYNQDLKNPNAIFALFVDFSQGFNRVLFSRIIELLSKMRVPGWLLKIMTSYFTDRKIKIRFKGLTSEEKSLNAGLGQGSLLGLWCFLVLINFAGPQSPPREIGLTVTEHQKFRKPIPVLKKIVG